jgi:hypothetical protein
MRPGDHIAVALTGTAADNALLLFFRNLTGKRRDIQVSGIPISGKIADHFASAREQGITRIALSTTLEMSAASLLADILRGDVERCTGSNPTHVDTPVLISPFCHIPAEEIAIYARIHGVGGDPSAPRQDDDPHFTEVYALLVAYSQRHPAAPHAILNLCDTLRNSVHHDPVT